MIFPKQTKWRKGILNKMKIRTKAPNFALTEELSENTDKSTKFWLTKLAKFPNITRTINP
jgi:hypothetical protein